MGYLDSQNAQPRKSDDLDRHAGQGAAVRGHALASVVKAQVDGRGRRVSGGPRGRPLVPARSIRRRICCAPAIGPVGHLKEMGHSGRDGALEGVGQAADGSSLDRAVILHPPWRSHMNEHTRRHIQVCGCATPRDCRALPKATCFVVFLSKSAWHAVGAQIGFAAHLRQTRPTPRPGAGQARLGATRGAEPIVQFNLPVRHARPRPPE